MLKCLVREPVMVQRTVSGQRTPKPEMVSEMPTYCHYLGIKLKCQCSKFFRTFFFTILILGKKDLLSVE